MSAVRRLPTCCGSEDGDRVYGIDPAPDVDTMVEAWQCHTCGLITITSTVHTTATQ